MREETDKEGRKRGIGHHLTGWLSQENREAILVDVTLTLAFLALAVLVVILTVVLLGSDRLKLENDVERKFNELVFDIQQNRTDSQVIMGDESILGVGLYDSSGRLVRGWGQVYNMLPVASIASATGDSGSDTIMRYDSDSRTMIYIRFLREPLAVGNVGTMTMSFLSGDLVRDNSTIMYLAFDGSAYIARRNIVYLSSFLGVLGVCLLYVFVLRINIQNRQYKEEMVRQGNLVNLGQAARTLTHEIKNPLSAITIQTALLKRQLRDSEYLDEIQRELGALSDARSNKQLAEECSKSPRFRGVRADLGIVARDQAEVVSAITSGMERREADARPAQDVAADDVEDEEE